MSCPASFGYVDAARLARAVDLDQRRALARRARSSSRRGTAASPVSLQPPRTETRRRRVVAHDRRRVHAQGLRRLAHDLPEDARRIGLADERASRCGAARPARARARAPRPRSRPARPSRPRGSSRSARPRPRTAASRAGCRCSESRTNGPEPLEVSQIVSTEAASSAAAAPRGPKRSAAQISAGKSTYGTSWLRGQIGQDEQDDRDQRRALEPSDAPGQRARASFAQVSIAGVTTSSARRGRTATTCARSCRRRAPAGRPRSRSRARRELAPSAVPTAEQPIRTSTSLHPQAGRRAPRRMSSAAVTTTATTVPRVWPSVTPSGVE